MIRRSLATLTVSAALLLVPAVLLPPIAEAGNVRYVGSGTKSPAMDVTFVLRNRNSLRRLSFNDIPMRCENGRRYRTRGRRFTEPIRLNNQNEFRARASGDISNGSHERARVRGRVRPRRGKARGVLRVTATFDSGLRCRSGRQPFRARRI